jgi:hypothetical protein
MDVGKGDGLLVNIADGVPAGVPDKPAAAVIVAIAIVVGFTDGFIVGCPI